MPKNKISGKIGGHVKVTNSNNNQLPRPDPKKQPKKIKGCFDLDDSFATV